MNRRKHNWTKIDLAYIVGDMTLHELADSEGISFNTLANHAKRAKYTEKREEYKKMVLQKLAKITANRDADAIRDLMTATEKAIGLLNMYIADDATLHNYVTGQTEVRLDKMDTKAMRNMSGALRDIACVLKTLYPDSTDGSGDGQDVVIMPDRESE